MRKTIGIFVTLLTILALAGGAPFWSVFLVSAFSSYASAEEP